MQVPLLGPQVPQAQAVAVVQAQQALAQVPQVQQALLAPHLGPQAQVPQVQQALLAPLLGPQVQQVQQAMAMDQAQVPQQVHTDASVGAPGPRVQPPYVSPASWELPRT